jgi:L,D-transpeptidase YcbB
VASQTVVRRLLAALVPVLAGASPLAAQSVPVNPDTVAALLLQAAHPWLSRDGNFSDVQWMVRAAVERDAEPLTWTTPAGRATAAARGTLRAIAGSDELLATERADIVTLDSMATRFDATPASDADRARFDIGVSIVAARHAAMRRQGRVNPRWVHEEWSLAAPDLDIAGVLRALADGSSVPTRTFDALEPATVHYAALKDGLTRVREDAARVASLHPRAPQAPVRVNSRYDDMPTLTRLLIALGEVPASTRAMARGRVRTVVLDSAMIAQFTNELPRREQRLRMAVERWRWLPRAFPNQPLVVNLPAFRLETYGLFSGDSADGINMNVVIGRADSNATPVFAANMNQVVFSPRWHVPMSIMTKEIGPKAQANPSYLARNGYELVRRGRVIPATAANIAAIGTGVYVRQQPGNGNSLGLVKFLMPNPYDIYLHDTPSKRLFNAERRDFSHGCVRLANPSGLAQYVLRSQPVWTDERISEAMRGGEERYVRVPRPIPVLVMYQTAVARRDGTVRYYQDIYGHDRTLWPVLMSGRPPAPAIPADSTRSAGETGGAAR